ncbi:helix-turn-helix transcriptional regulator, partial [Staphylococcus aureus]|uniref:helix-turn-helix domain-containing protein n=1 Tax=Staphylococcus aureus TaxID=1280 RepID=UPI0023B0DCFE
MSMIYRNVEDVGGLFLALRRELGISQEKLADQIGAHRQYIYKVENGKQEPTLDFLVRFQKVGRIKRVLIAI